jgi:hypothetical protein
MFHIRYYSDTYHPHKFSKGVLGLLIRTLNWIRWRTEVLVQRLVLSYLAREKFGPELRKQATKGLVKQFWVDDKYEVLKSEVPPTHTSLFPDEHTEENLEAVSVNQVTRGADIENLIRRMADRKRSKRYGNRSRAKGLLFEDFEAIE